MPRVLPSEVVKAIDLFYPSVASKPMDTFDIDISNTMQLGAVLNLVDEIPPELITLKGEEYTFYVTSLGATRAAFDALVSRGGSVRLYNLRGFGGMNPLSCLRSLLQKLPDQFPLSTTSGLSFITEADLRDDLRMDISVANQAMSNGEWKPATIIAGSAIEALLLWSLQEPRVSKARVRSAIEGALARELIKADPGPVIENWVLSYLIEVAGELRVIKEKTVSQCRLARDFRNLIHPGRSVRLGEKCNRATALTAIAALEHVVNDLTPQQ